MASTVTERLAGFDTGAAIKSPVLVASTAALVLSSTQVIDGIAVSTDDRVLVKDQADPADNGIYEVGSAAWSRAADFDGSRDVVRGTLVYCSTGTFNGDKVFQVTSTGDNVPGSSTGVTFGNASHIASSITVSTFAEQLIDDSSAVDMRATLGLVIGTDVQAFDAQLADLAAQTPSTGALLYYSSGSSLVTLAKGTTSQVLFSGATGPRWQALGLASSDMPSGTVLQVESTQDGAVLTGTTIMPSDNTIPQSSEGDAYLLLDFTPKLPTSKLHFLCSLAISSSVSSAFKSGALFSSTDEGNACLASGMQAKITSGHVDSMSFGHTLATPSTNTVRYMLRAGNGTSATTTINGQSLGGKLGGTVGTFLRIMEVAG